MINVKGSCCIGDKSYDQFLVLEEFGMVFGTVQG